MRLLVVHPRLNVLGGGERVAIHSIIEALREGFEVYLAAEKFDLDSFRDFFGVNGIFNQVHLLTYPPFRPIACKAVIYQRILYNQLRLRKIISTYGPFDVVLNTAEIGNHPSSVVPSIQYCYFPEYFSHLESAGVHTLWDLYYSPARVFYRARVSRVDRILAVSNFTRDIVKELWGRESTTLYPPCPIHLYSDLNMPKEDLVVTVGRIAPEKRMDLFLEMARELPQVKFVIVGSIALDKRSYADSLKRIAPENLSIAVAPLRKVRDVLGRAKVYVHCARNEHFGITIVEAMSAGVVPVVNNSGGPREIVSEDVGYKWDTIPEAVEQISKMVKDDALRRQFAIAAARRSKFFGPEEFESGMGRVLEEFR